MTVSWCSFCLWCKGIGCMMSGNMSGPDGAGNTVAPGLTLRRRAGMNAIERAPRPDLRVEKQGYSHGPWRVLYAATGEQVWQRDVIDHPNLGRITIPGPVCFQRKRDAVAWVQEQVAKWDAAGPVWVDVIDTPAMPPYGSPERAEVDRLVALVGTVCPACKSEILQRSDGEVFCWDVYCGQQLDAYRKATS